MPLNNRFQHQPYPTVPSQQPQILRLSTKLPMPVDGQALHAELGVTRVVLVHGTFVGDDPVGIVEMLRTIADSVPAGSTILDRLAEEVRVRTRPLASDAMQDVANFHPTFQKQFQELVGPDPVIELPAQLWSSQNHHLARAELAVQLLHKLMQWSPGAGERILFWGHSHAGNAFALLSNLLANDRDTVARFFDAVGTSFDPVWNSVRRFLESGPSPHPFARAVDFATFGTPVRYGWDPSGYRSLVHVLHHRHPDPEQPFRTKPLFPPQSPLDVINARYGDWVQAFAITGTDTPTLPSAEINERLESLLERNLSPPAHDLDTRFLIPERIRDACARWKSGTRCHTDGVNLLVDYEPSGETVMLGQPIEESLFGHGVATTNVWLPTHLNLVISHLTAAGA
jgi:hypothetical protein